MLSQAAATTSGTMHKLAPEQAASLFPGFSRITEGHATVFFAPPKSKSSSDTALPAPAGDNNNNKQKQKKKSDNVDDDDDGATGAAGADASKGDISVFYNPPQVVNRDLSVCVLQTFANERPSEPPRKGGTGSDGLVVLEALSASGLRAVRYWHEVKGLRTIIANDLDADAVECIRRNVDANDIRVVKGSELCAAEQILRNVKGRKYATDEEAEKARTDAVAMSSGVIANRDDAIVLMQRAGWDPKLYPPGNFFMQDNNSNINSSKSNAKDEKQKKEPEPMLHSVLFDCIDLDPYGTVGPFLDSTMDAAKEGALLSVTSTDSAVLCGNFPETALAKYGSSGIKGDACHEMAPRIVLAALEKAANRRGKYIEPLLSLHIDFYVRVFVRVYTQPAEVKIAMCKLALQVQCSWCPQYHLQPLGAVPRARAGRGNGGANKQQKEGGGGGGGAAGEGEHLFPAPQSFPHIPDRSQGAANFHHNAFSDYSPEGSARCVCCGGRLLVGGPLYCGPMHNRAFCDKLLAEISRRGASNLKAFARVRGLVYTARDELSDVPLFIKLDKIAAHLKMCCPPSLDIQRALERMGYRSSSVHCETTGFKTDAPMKILMGTMLQHKALFGHDAGQRDAVMAKLNENKKNKNKKKDDADDADGTAAAAATSAVAIPDKFKDFLVPLATADFTYWTDEEKADLKKRREAAGAADAAAAGGAKKMPRFVQNAPHWGPRAKHTGAAAAAAGDDDTSGAAVRRERNDDQA